MKTEPPLADVFPGKAALLKGTFFVVGAQALRISLTFLSLVVLSRILAPKDFGLVACLTPLLTFIYQFQDMGLQQAVVQRTEITKEQLNKIFWLLFAVGVACAGLLCLASPAVARFYHEPRLLWLTVAASVPLVISSVTSLPLGILNREMQFHKLAALECAVHLIGFLTALAGALAGMGYWALMVAPITSSIVHVTGAMWASRWTPSAPAFRIERDIIDFGANLTGFNFLNFFARNLDNILIGRYEGAEPLGYYDRAYKLLVFPLSAINYPLSRVVVPVLSRMQDDKAHVNRLYLRITGLLALATVPGMAAALAVPHDVILLLFGEKWLPVVPIFCWLALSGLVQPLSSTSGWLFISQGKTKQMLRWGLFSSATAILSFVIGLHWGAVGVAAAYAISEYVIRTPGMYWYMERIGLARARDYAVVQLPLLAAAALTWAAVRVLFAGALGIQGIPLIACALFFSYVSAAGFSALHAPGRAALREVFDFAFRYIPSRIRTGVKGGG